MTEKKKKPPLSFGSGCCLFGMTNKTQLPLPLGNGYDKPQTTRALAQKVLLQ